MISLGHADFMGPEDMILYAPAGALGTLKLKIKSCRRG
jgi:hypothetical protein